MAKPNKLPMAVIIQRNAIGFLELYEVGLHHDKKNTQLMSEAFSATERK